MRDKETVITGVQEVSASENTARKRRASRSETSTVNELSEKRDLIRENLSKMCDEGGSTAEGAVLLVKTRVLISFGWRTESARWISLRDRNGEK